MSKENITYSLDTSLISAQHDLITREWDFTNIYSVGIDAFLKTDADDILNHFLEKYPDLQYRVEFGRYVIMHNKNFTVRFDGVLGAFVTKPDAPKRYEEEIVVSGSREAVIEVVKTFNESFKDKVINKTHNVEWVSLGAQGMETVTIPVKTNQVVHNEMYPFMVGEDKKYKTVDEYIDAFMESDSNVLIFTGPPGTGKSAFITRLILRADKRTQVVYDPKVMSVDQLYTGFIQRCFRDEGGIMVMEDADLILTSRETSQNETMAKILNISSGALDTSQAKFIFTANINRVSDIDEALTRPGRCFDIVQFRNLTHQEAEVAAEVVGKNLIGNKDEYTVAEIYNEMDDAANRAKLGGMGFGMGFR